MQESSRSRMTLYLLELKRSKAAKNAGRNNSAADVPSIQNQAATTSLGENDALAALKAKMEKGE